MDLITTLDQDGAEPDDRELSQLNELHLTRDPAGSGGRIKGQLDAPTFDAVATALSALTRPTAEGTRSLGQRQADALGEVCQHTLDHALVPSVGGERPHLNVMVSLTELEGRGRGALLDIGGTLAPGALRRLPATPGSSRWCWAEQPTTGHRPGNAHVPALALSPGRDEIRWSTVRWRVE